MKKNNSTIPRGWCEGVLASVAVLNMGQSPTSDSYNQNEMGLPFFQGKADFSKISNKPVVRQWTSAPTKISEAGDILITVRAPVGDLAINDRRACIGRGLASVRAKENNDQSFIFYLLQSLNEELNAKAQGSTFTAINTDALGNIAVIMPPINEQQKIAEILGAVDEDIAKTQEVIDATEKLKRGLMEQLFTRGIGHTKFKETEIGNLPIDWKAVSLGKYVDIRSGDTPSGFNFEINAAIPFYKVEEMNNSSKYMISTRYFFNSYNKALMPKGMIVFPKRGASIYMNKVRILSSDSYFDTNVMGLITKNGLYSEYLYYLLIHIGLSQFADTTSVPQINNKHIEPLLVPLPGNNEQKKIADTLSAVDEKISVNKKLKEKLTLLKKGLMQDLLSGSKRVKI